MKTSKRNSKRVIKRNKQFNKLVYELFKDFWHESRIPVMPHSLSVSLDRCESLVDWLQSLPKKIETFRLDPAIRFRTKRDSRFKYSLQRIEILSNYLALPALYPDSYGAILLALNIGFHFGIVLENPGWVVAERVKKDIQIKRKLANKTNRIKRRSFEVKRPIILAEFQKVTRGNTSLSASRAMKIVSSHLTHQRGGGFSFSTVRRAVEK